VLLLLAGPVTASASDEPTVTPASPSALGDRPTTLRTVREDHAWRLISSMRAVELTGVAGDERRTVVVSALGEVWIRERGSQRWTTVLAPVASRLGIYSQEEEIRLSAEARMEEVLEDLRSRGEVEEGDEADEAVDEGVGEADDAMDDAAGELPADVGSDPLMAFQSGSGGGLRPRVWLPGDGLIVVARPDGLMVSSDEGQSWRRAFGGPVSSFERTASGRAVVGTAEGLWWSDDLRGWRPAEGLNEDVVWDVDEQGGIWLAATDDGLWRSIDGASWAEHGDLEQEIHLVRHDPWSAGVVWAATATSVLRSDDGGGRFRAPTGPVLGGVHDLVFLGPELRLAAGEEGPWESRDDGSVWVSVRRGLAGASAHAFAWVGAELLVATGQGLLSLERADEAPDPASAEDLAWIAVDHLIEAAMRREGSAPGRDWLGASGQALAYLLPTLTLQYTSTLDRSIGSELDAGIERRVASTPGFWVFLTWEPPARDLVSSGVVVIEDDDETEVFVGDIEDRVLLNRVTRRQSSSRTRVAHQVSEMYYNRQQLVRERAEGRAGRSLLDAVHLDLRIAEVEAWLDVLTDGAVSRYLAGRGADGGGG
jgi:hypothetical protein